jgi:hypothetical protein
MVTLAACSWISSPSASSTPSPSPGSDHGPDPSSSPAGSRIEHATGGTDVVLRFEEGGGFVPMGFFATEAPLFTLYGDGTVIFRDGAAFPPLNADGISRLVPYETIRLSEDEVQAFLQYAVADGGLGVAREHYDGPGADLPTAIFTINAAGRSKSVSVMALGMDRDPGPDSLILQALARLGDRIRSFAADIDDEVAWEPDRWRGVLTPDAGNPPRDWPWPGIVPADFVQRPEPGAPRFPIRTMAATEVDALGLDDVESGFSGLALSGPDGKTYAFALRPLLPDEAY